MSSKCGFRVEFVGVFILGDPFFLDPIGRKFTEVPMWLGGEKSLFGAPSLSFISGSFRASKAIPVSRSFLQGIWGARYPFD